MNTQDYPADAFDHPERWTFRAASRVLHLWPVPDSVDVAVVYLNLNGAVRSDVVDCPTVLLRYTPPDPWDGHPLGGPPRPPWAPKFMPDVAARVTYLEARLAEVEARLAKAEEGRG